MRFFTIQLMTASAMTMIAVQAYAQQNSAPVGGQAAQAGDGQIADIVVTASRVESRAQKTAVSLTTYTGKNLAAAGVSNVQALQTIDPSVNFTAKTGGGYVAVRGIASTDVTEIGDPSVPVARDGFFTNRSFSIGSSFYDVQRVEVLKGPQGTLFGRNSTGGLINIITTRPGKTSGGYANLAFTDALGASAEAGVNLPVSDRLQFRFSGLATAQRGYRDLIQQPRGDDDQTLSGRAQMAFEPIDGLRGLVSYQHDDVDDVGDVTASTPLATVLPANFNSKRFPNYQPTKNRLIGDRFRWELSYDRLPGDLTLTYSGGYDNQRWNHLLDNSTLNGGTAQQFVQSESPKTWNHEVRIATSQKNPFTLQAGFFHFDEHNVVNSGLLVQSGAYVGRYLIKFNYDIHTSSNAVFGQAGYKFGQIKLTAGARYTWDAKDRTGQAVLDLDVATGGFLPFTVTTPGNGTISQHKPTYHLGIDWSPTDRNLLYAKFDTGYKSGGFNSNGSAPSVNYGPENLKAWEIGSKNRFAGNTLQLNLAAFYQEYIGYQASQTSAVISTGSGIFNVGSAKIYGVEAQGVALIGKMRLDANATYLHANFDNNIPVVLDGTGAIRNISGNRLPNAPSFVVSGGLEYAIDLAGGAKLTPRIDGKYSSALNYSVFNEADTEQRHFATGNVSLTYASSGGRLEIQAFVRNFTDTTVLASATRDYVSNTNHYEFQAPRTFGARVGVKF